MNHLIDLDTLTPAGYATLPDYIRANIPDEVKARLRAHLDIDFLELGNQRRRAAAENSDPAMNALIRARLSPPTPTNDSYRNRRGQFLDRNPSEPCPNARHLGLKATDGALITTSVHCRTKGCPVCGPHWVALHTEGIGYRVEDHPDARWEVYTITPNQRERWRKAVARARKKGIDINGVSIPTHLDGTKLVLLARTCNTQICRSITPNTVDNPTDWAQLALNAAHGAAAEWNDIPADCKPRELSAISGLGEWKGNLLPYLGEDPETRHQLAYEFAELPDRDELVRMAMTAGMHVRKVPGGLELRERDPGAEQRLIEQLEVLEPRDHTPNWHSPTDVEPF